MKGAGSAAGLSRGRPGAVVPSAAAAAFGETQLRLQRLGVAGGVFEQNRACISEGRNPRRAARPCEGWLRVERGAGTSARLCRKSKTSVARIADGHDCVSGLPLCARDSGHFAGRHGDMFTLAFHVAFLCQCCVPVFVLGECSFCFRCFSEVPRRPSGVLFRVAFLPCCVSFVFGSEPSCRVCFGMLETSSFVETQSLSQDRGCRQSAGPPMCDRCKPVCRLPGPRWMLMLEGPSRCGDRR